MKKLNLIYVLAAFLLILVPGLYMLCHTPRSFSENENRILTTEASVGIKAFLSKEMQDELEDLLSDQFPERDTLTASAARLKTAAGYLAIDGVYLGKDDQLIEQYTDENMVDSRYTSNLSYVSQYAEAHEDLNTRLLLVPSPGTILSDKLPDNVPYYDADPAYEAAAATGLLVDIRDTLKAHKDEYLYFRTDHHWTTYGAYLAAGVLETVQSYESYGPTEVSDSFEGTLYSKVLDDSLMADTLTLPENLPEVEVTIGEETTDSIYDMSYLEQKSKYDVYFGGNPGSVVIKTQAGTGRKLLLVKDSFANSLVPYLLESYDEIELIDLRYYPGSVASLTESKDFTDVLFVYEMSNFAEDANLYKLIR